MFSIDPTQLHSKMNRFNVAGRDIYRFSRFYKPAESSGNTSDFSNTAFLSNFSKNIWGSRKTN